MKGKNMFDRFKKGFRQSKKLNRKQKDREEASADFIKDYEVVCKKHGLQLDAKIEVTPEGIMPKIQILEYNPAPPEKGFETKDWDEAKKENAEMRKKEAEKKEKENGDTDNK